MNSSQVVTCDPIIERILVPRPWISHCDAFMRPCFSCLWSCAGWIYDISGDYAAAFYSCGGISFLAASLTSFIPRLSTQSNQETGSKRLAKLLRRRRSNHRSEVMHVLFGCLWKEKQESRASSFVQHSGIQATNKRVDVWNESNWSDTLRFHLTAFFSV